MSQETTLATATDVSLAAVVRLVNTGATTLVTVKDGDTIVASFHVAAGEVVNVQKSPTQTLIATASVKAVKIAYTN